jgi:hypothetical protein
VPSLDLYRQPDPFRTPRRSEFRDPIDVLAYAVMALRPLSGAEPRCSKVSPRLSPIRLAHSYDNQVTDDCPVSACGSAYTSPQSHDRADYYQIW